MKKIVLIGLLFLMQCCTVSAFRTSVEVDITSRAKGYLEKIATPVLSLQQCLHEYHSENPGQGILASPSNLLAATCPVVCGNAVESCKVNLTTGRICTKFSGDVKVVVLQNSVIIFDPLISSSNDAVNFMDSNCRHNIKSISRYNTRQDGEIDVVIEGVGASLVGCTYDSSIDVSYADCD